MATLSRSCSVAAIQHLVIGVALGAVNGLVPGRSYSRRTYRSVAYLGNQDAYCFANGMVMALSAYTKVEDERPPLVVSHYTSIATGIGHYRAQLSSLQYLFYFLLPGVTF